MWHRCSPVVSRLAAPLAAFAAIGAAFVYVGSVDPNEPGHYPACPLLELTGLYCPGCGGLRTAHALAHGEFATALSSNATAVAAIAVFAGFWVFWVVRAVRARPVVLHLVPWQMWTVGGLALVFTVVRNLPFGEVLAP